jgi:hypothetical protein
LDKYSMRIFLPILAILVLASCGGSAPPVTSTAPDTVYRKEMQSQGHQNLDPLINELTKKKNRPAMAEKAAPRAPSNSKAIPPPVTPGIRIGNEAAKSAQKIKPPTVNTVDEILNQLSVASIAFSVPELINIRDKVKVQLLIDPTVNPALLEQRITVKGKTTSTKLLVSKIVSANLIATDGITVKAITPERQAISLTQPTEWVWELLPVKPGKFELYLVVNAEVQVDSTRASRQIKTFEEVIEVEVTARQQVMLVFEKYWQWVWTAMLLPLGVWGWKRWRNIKE